MLDLLVKNGKLVSPSYVILGDVGIEDEKIVAIGRSAGMPEAREVIDVEGKHVIPGCIDVHVHFREPLRQDKEDWLTGSKGAVLGGVTTVVDMPESTEPTVEGLSNKLREAEKKSLVDYGLYGRPSSPQDVRDFAEFGVLAYKIYLGYPEFAPDDGTFLQLLKEIGKTNLPVSVHAENYDIIEVLEKELIKEGKTDIFAHGMARPNYVEEESIAKSILMARVAECRLHIAHLSTKEGLELIREAKRKGQKVTTETGPHYLVLTEEDLKKHGPYGKICPPVRGVPSDVNALWNGLNDGTVDCMATDHAPHLISGKEVGWKNIFDASPGAVSVQTMLPLMLTEVNRGRMPLTKLVEVTSTNPSKIFNMYPRKGTIQIGSDADLVILDLEKESTIRKDEQQSKMPYTIYDGWKIKGSPITTIIRGKIVMHDGQIKADKGYGKWIKPLHSNE
jgi:D-hydantoinase